MNIKKWLRGQLTNVKNNEQAWGDLTNALGDALEVYVEPWLDRIKSRISLFEQGTEELHIELKELGDFFSFGDIEDENLAITILQRKDQIHFKRTLSPLISTLNREFYGVGVSWQALYNPIDAEYGVGMVTKETSNGKLDLNKYWLTSRGIIQVPINKVLSPDRGLNDILDEFDKEIERVVKPLIPLRIVYDGVLYIIIYQIKERLESLELVDVGVAQSVGHNLTKYYRLDSAPIDYKTLDSKLSYTIDDTITPENSHAHVSLAEPSSWKPYRIGASPMASVPIDTQAETKSYETIAIEPTETAFKIGGDLVYSYRLDAMPLDLHSLDFVPEIPRENDSISHVDEVYVSLPIKERKDVIRLSKVILDGEVQS
ncbi:hypothetical protein [Vibrio campbellii]|uniref:hypothetical protein n=1 Tax=Vibrio campbellii TaxID=680 RepID=UPI00210B7D95|nr:hypothetical protein [Vibrio campbellii]UTZ44606.1 hypothetical protein HB764_25440 [Vibrio campbellii]